MKKNPLSRRPGLAKWALSALAPLALAQSAQGVITVHFAESGPDVVISFNGTLSVAGPAGMTPLQFYPTGYFLQNDCMFVGDDNGLDNYSLPGTVSISAISVSQFGVPLSPGDVGYFGFVTNNLFFQESYVTGGSLATGVTELTVTPATATYRVPNETLASIGADGIANGTVLWTADGSGDTFVFSSAPVPEPSSLLLGGLGLLGLLRRKR